MQIHQRDISDVLQFLPTLKPIEEESFGLVHCQLLICALGFEDRTSAVISKLAQGGLLKDALLLLVCYPTNEEENSVHLAEFEAAALLMRGIKTISYSRTNFAEQLAEVTGALEQRARVSLDVSTCSSYLFYPIMRDLVMRDVNLTIVYAEALVYYPTLAEWKDVADRADKEGSLFVKSFEEADFQSLGVEEVYPYSIFSEMNPGNRASALVAVPNFSALRMSAIIARDRELNKTSFRNIVWILGDPPAPENKWRVDAIKRTNNLVQNVNDENFFSVSTRDYKDMIETLENIWLQRRYGFQISVGSLGSKMQHMGTFFFLFLHQEVGIWLAEPSKFQASRFSTGVSDVWQIELGYLPELRKNLSSYMTFDWKF
jgi:hypothetical protein